MAQPLVALGIQQPDFQQTMLRKQQYQMNQQQMGQQNALSQFFGQQGPALMSGDQGALNDYARIDPKGAISLRGDIADGKKKEIEAAITKEGLITSTINAVLNSPETADKQTLWNALKRNLETQYGIPADKAPEQWDDNWARTRLQQGLTYAQQLEQMKADPGYIGRVREEQTRGELRAKQDFPQQNDEPLVEVYDKTSPTGTRLVRRSEAMGQPGKPGSGLRLTTGPNGEIELTQGPGVGGPGGGLTRPTQNEVQKRVLSSGDQMASISAIKQKFNPKFQQIGTRWSNLVNAWRDRMGYSLSTAEKTNLAEFSAYKAEASQMFSNMLKELSGTAVSASEMSRAQAWLPNPGTGLADGDSPTELQAKIERMEDFTKKALAKYAYINRNGLDVNAIDVDQMPMVMQQRGDELAAQYGAAGLQGAALKRAVRDTLVDEFGLGAQ
jgi:hypothetical protein